MIVIANTCVDTYCVVARDCLSWVEVLCIPVVAWSVDGCSLRPLHVFSSTSHGRDGEHLCILSHGMSDGHLHDHLRMKYSRSGKPLVYRDPSGIYHKYFGVGLIPMDVQSGDAVDMKSELGV
jgi:hypothetical protein